LNRKSIKSIPLKLLNNTALLL